MNFLRLTFVLVISTLLAACGAPDTDSSSAGFFELGLPSTYNKLEDSQEMKAHEVVTMAEEVLASVNEQDLAEGLSYKSYFKTGNYVAQNFNAEIRPYCKFLELSEDGRSKSVKNRWVEDVQKSTRQLDLNKGQELINCPLDYRSSTVTTSATTKASENVSSLNESLNLNIDMLKAVDSQKSTNQKYVYLKKVLTPVSSISVSSTSDRTKKDLRDHKHPGKNVVDYSKSIRIVYKEAGVDKVATIKVIYREITTEKMPATSLRLKYGRAVSALVVATDSGTATVEESTVFNGDLESDTYTKVNGKLILQNGQVVN